MKQAADRVGLTYSRFRENVDIFPYYQIGKRRLYNLQEVEDTIKALRVGTKAEVLS